MGLLDGLKEKAAEAMEKGTELAKTQQLKLELRKLESALDDAYATYGRRAYALRGQEAGTAGLDTEAQAIRDAHAAVEAKQAEITAVGEEAAKSTTEV